VVLGLSGTHFYAVLAAGPAAACGQGRSGSLPGKSVLVVGVRPDLPSLGPRRLCGGFEGFDIHVASRKGQHAAG